MRQKKFKSDKIYYTKNESETRELLRKHPRTVFSQWDIGENDFNSKSNGAYYNPREDKYYYVCTSISLQTPFREPLASYANNHTWKYNETLDRIIF